MRKLSPAVLYLLFIASPLPAATSGNPTAVEALPDRFCEAWASHDGHALAALMSQDVDFVNVGATWLQGKRAFELYHTRLLQGRFRDALLDPIDRKVTVVRPDLAFVRWTWRMAGDRSPDGSARPPRTGLMTMLAEKRNGRWLIIAAQNTNAGPGGAPETAGISSPLSLPRETATNGK